MTERVEVGIPMKVRLQLDEVASLRMLLDQQMVVINDLQKRIDNALDICSETYSLDVPIESVPTASEVKGRVAHVLHGGPLPILRSMMSMSIEEYRAIYKLRHDLGPRH